MRSEILGVLAGALAFVAAVAAVTGCEDDGAVQRDPRIELEERCKRQTSLAEETFDSDPCGAYWLRAIAEGR